MRTSWAVVTSLMVDDCILIGAIELRLNQPVITYHKHAVVFPVYSSLPWDIHKRNTYENTSVRRCAFLLEQLAGQTHTFALHCPPHVAMGKRKAASILEDEEQPVDNGNEQPPDKQTDDASTAKGKARHKLQADKLRMHKEQQDRKGMYWICWTLLEVQCFTQAHSITGIVYVSRIPPHMVHGGGAKNSNFVVNIW